MPARSVLIVEDDEDIRQNLSEILEGEGYSVTQAANGKEALDYLRGCSAELRPDCIILDLMMPVMSGEEFLKIMRDEHPDDLAAIPVFVATAKGSASIPTLGLPMAPKIIRKPIDLEDLLSTLESCC